MSKESKNDFFYYLFSFLLSYFLLSYNGVYGLVMEWVYGLSACR